MKNKKVKKKKLRTNFVQPEDIGDVSGKENQSLADARPAPPNGNAMLPDLFGPIESQGSEMQ